MNCNRAMVFVALVLAMACLAAAFPDPAVGYGTGLGTAGLGRGFVGGFNRGFNGGFVGTHPGSLVVNRPVVRGVVPVGRGFRSGLGGFGFPGGFGW